MPAAGKTQKNDTISYHAKPQSGSSRPFGSAFRCSRGREWNRAAHGSEPFDWLTALSGVEGPVEPLTALSPGLLGRRRGKPDQSGSKGHEESLGIFIGDARDDVLHVMAISVVKDNAADPVFSHLFAASWLCVSRISNTGNMALGSSQHRARMVMRIERPPAARGGKKSAAFPVPTTRRARSGLDQRAFSR